MSEDHDETSAGESFIQKHSDREVASLILGMSVPKQVSPGFFDRLRSSASRTRREEAQQKEISDLLDRMEKLHGIGVDPSVFEQSLSDSQDRYLKGTFGHYFLVSTIAFTLLSYGIVILNATLQWHIDRVAITGLVIETPLQFFGLLYIIANNLFPGSKVAKSDRHKRRRITARGTHNRPPD